MHPITALNPLLRRLLEERGKDYRHVLEALQKDSAKSVLMQNLPGGALAFVLASLAERLKRPLLVLTAGVEAADELVNDFEFFGVPALSWPKWEVLPYDVEELPAEPIAKTLDCYAELLATKPGMPLTVVATIDAMMQRTLPLEAFAARSMRVNWGDTLELDKFQRTLDANGYERVPIVESRGQYAIRGNIVDVFPVNANDPYRLDLFGDEIESIRLFDVQTQRSREQLGTDAALLLPPATVKGTGERAVTDGIALVSPLELLPEGTLVVLDNPEKHDELCLHFEQAVDRQYFEILKQSPDLHEPRKLTLSRAELLRALERFRRVEHTVLPVDTTDRSVTRVPFDTRGFAVGGGDLDGWMSAFKRLHENSNLLVVVCDNDGQVQRMDELMREHHIPAEPFEPDANGKFKMPDVLRGAPDVLLVTGRLTSGFHFPGVLVAFVTDREMFGRYKRRPVYKKIYKGRPIASSADIQRGDFVVHVEHGIGRYTGMRQQQIDGRAVDLIEIVYAGDDKLLVPVDKIRNVQKYSSVDTPEPSLDKLGSGRWQKRRAKANEEIQKIANELLALYAKREAARRRDYGPDTPMMHEFEASFFYEETPDQKTAIAAIKEDMQNAKPMDRVLCGDVGYGKTEVAIRGVFKCVQAGRQAAVLCPTTILAQQHYNTMRERFADYPVRVDVVSRFRDAKQVKETLRKLKNGEIDVIVGTHRLLSADVKFLDLGLVVVDEEHRFGVKSKEHLKELRADVDFLTLSATPIPRTLHMAIGGLRDLSLINTPPPDRQPIKTKLITFEEAQVAEAILRELNRGGQVYFVHNRVATIHEVAKRLNEIVPHARICVAHGQMKETELEEVMQNFIDHQHDILIATTIIESGIDIPNCNTIIINRADMLGLSQLYQLRGRVGREKRRAYAYLIVPPGEGITETAVKRLAAIEEFSELGSGFNIAMRDMEIRGTGNLLGKEQHGTIGDIGFEMYCEMLKDAASNLRGEEVLEDRDTEIRFELSSVIPPQFVPVETQRLTFYKRFAVAREEREVADLESELRDRYGEIPESVRALLGIARLRIASKPLHLGAIKQSGAKVRLTFYAPEARNWVEDFQKLAGPGRALLRTEAESSDTLALTMAPDKKPFELLGIVKVILEEVNAAVRAG